MVGKSVRRGMSSQDKALSRSNTLCIARGRNAGLRRQTRRAPTPIMPPSSEARSSSYAAMVRAWLRQRRIIPAPDPIAGGINGHMQPSRCSRVQRPCPPPRRSKLRIVRFRAGTKAHSLRCSSSSNHNRFAGLRFEIDEGDLSPVRFRTDPAISLWRQE